MKTKRAILALPMMIVAAAACGEADLGSASDDITEGLVCEGSESEPNDGEDLAVRLESSDDCNGGGGSTEAILAGAEDVDWFYFEGFDVPYCVVDPSVTVSISTPDVQVCSFFECVEGGADTVDLECPEGSEAVTSEGGLPGCCAAGGSLRVTDVNCVGTSAEDIDVFFRVNAEDAADRCVDYELSYHY